MAAPVGAASRARLPTALRPSRWSLRTRLLAALMSLIAAVCLVVALATGIALQRYLLGRLDSQVVAAANRSPIDHGFPPDGQAYGQPGAGGDDLVRRPDRGGLAFLTDAGQSAGTLGARITGGVISAGQLTEDGTPRALTATQTTALGRLPVDRKPHTLSIPGAGAFRLIAAKAPDGDVIVIGLPLAGLNETLSRLAVAEVGVALAALLAAAVAGAAIIRRTLRPLARVAATASRVATLPLHRGEVALAERVPVADTDPRTEVGQVGAALNRLLGHVGSALAARQASEMRVRQFVADASHELRTPLAAIRGYAELTRRDRASASPDLAYALGRVESEADRMTTLVEDLLLLARLDSGRPLAEEPVDLSRLVIDAVSDASAMSRGHRWHLGLPEDPVVVTGDAARLHQVLANLLANAATHTPPGTTVTASVTAEPGGSVLLSVVDDGPGIPADLVPHVFERFARGDVSRSHWAGSGDGAADGGVSTGLGLAIVESVVTAHGGSVSVASRPGRTDFRVRLPAPSEHRPVGTSSLPAAAPVTSDSPGRAQPSSAAKSPAAKSPAATSPVSGAPAT